MLVSIEVALASTVHRGDRRHDEAQEGDDVGAERQGGPVRPAAAARRPASPPRWATSCCSWR
jgi:hypothetical protein